MNAVQWKLKNKIKASRKNHIMKNDKKIDNIVINEGDVELSKIDVANNFNKLF